MLFKNNIIIFFSSTIFMMYFKRTVNHLWNISVTKREKRFHVQWKNHTQLKFSILNALCVRCGLLCSRHISHIFSLKKVIIFHIVIVAAFIVQFSRQRRHLHNNKGPFPPSQSLHTNRPMKTKHIKDIRPFFVARGINILSEN